MMTAVRPLVRGVALSLLTATAAMALPGTAFERAEIFAKCSGRLEALATNQRALKNPQQSLTQQVLDDFDMMLDATLPAAIAQGVPPTQAVRWRSSGWSEIAALLSDVAYSFDHARAQRAEVAIDQRINACQNLLLSDATSAGSFHFD